MDTTETYIKMSDCPEIQGQWSPMEGDCCVKKLRNGGSPMYLLEALRSGFITARGWGENDVLDEKESLWLPYQHQLQAMVGTDPYQTLKDFHDWRLHHGYTKLADEDTFTSMEQLWLAFVQKELHGKTWDGKEWQ